MTPHAVPRSRAAQAVARLLGLAVGTATSCALAAPVKGTDTLEPIVVTATRAAVDALDYAGSASRLDAAELAALGAVHSSELLNRAPGSFLQRGSGQEVLVAIRSPVLTGAGACGAFLVLEDGVPIRPVGFCNVNELFEVNLEQASAVEILRGPGVGVLGANAVHGVVNVLGPTPASIPPIGMSLEGGSDDWRQAALATRIGDGPTRGALVAHYTHDGGFRADSGFDEWKANAVVEHPVANGVLRVRLAATDLDQQTAGFVVGRDAYRDPVLRRSNPNPEAFRQARSARLVASWSGASFDVSAYARTSRMEFLQHFLLGQPLERNGQRSAGALLAWHGTAGALDWRAGLDLEAARGDLVEDQARPTTGGTAAANAIRPAGLHYDYVVDSKVAAPWALVEWRLAPRLRATVAVRAEWTRYDYDNRMIDGNTAANGAPCAFGGCLYSRPADRRDTFSNVAPRAGLAWRFADGHAAYVSAAQGFRPPEATELYRLQRQQRIATLGSEDVVSYELGLRGALGRTLRYDLAAYAMDKRNVILRDAVGFNVDDGRTRHRGVEYEFAWTPIDALSLSALGTHAVHTYRFDRNVDGGEAIRSGNDIDTAPRNLLTLRATVRPTPRLRAEAEWLRVGPYWADAANLNRYPGHALLNLRAGVELGRGFDVRARVLNVTDRAYADRADFAFGNWRYFPGRGRTWYLELGYAVPSEGGGSDR
jgi:outer membrane receptor protein involved in Fe transport